MLLATAPFTPAVGISFIMLLVAGVMGYSGYIQSALALLLINTLAVIGSPGIDISNSSSLIGLLIIFLAAFGGVMLGVRKIKVDT